MSIYFTSGTTGNPKGAMRTHNHLVATSFSGVIENKIGYDERVLVVTPMYHVSFEDNIGRCFLVPNTRKQRPMLSSKETWYMGVTTSTRSS